MDIKFSCTDCGQHVVIHEDNAGQEVDCPHCGRSLTVPERSTLPAPATPAGNDIFFGCYKCGQNIVIDAAGIGQLVNCPQCGIYLVVPNKPGEPAVLASAMFDLKERAIH